MDTLDNQVLDLLDPNTPRKSAKVVYVPAKVCEVCHQNKADNEKFFAPGSNVCLICQDRQEELAGRPLKNKALHRLLDAIENGQEIPHSSHVMASIYRHMGGVDGIGQKMAETYDAAKLNDDVKVQARVLDIAIRLQVKVSSDRQQVAIASMDRAELRAYLTQLTAEYIDVTSRDPLSLPAPRAETEVRDE